MDSKSNLLREWSRYVAQAARQGGLTGQPITITRIEGIAGPRAGALELLAGLEAGKLLRALARNDAAMLRQFIPWAFTGEPTAYMAGRYVRLEAGWPNRLAETMIRLGDLGRHPKGAGRWVAGKNEYGATVLPSLNDRTPHFLVSGATGSGKSVALRSAILQLSQDPTNQFVLIDGKYGESLNQIAHLPGIVGPVAIDGPGARAALGWACREMRRRYESGHHAGRIVVVIDEIQEFAGDEIIISLLKKIAAQGRAAGIHCLVATQHPTVSAFGDPAIRRNLAGKLALRVADSDASRVAVGGRLPRADHLLGAGDCYTVAPGAVHRVQGVYVDNREIAQADSGQRELDEWPEYQAEPIRDLPGQEVGWSYGGPELAVSIISASQGEGRPTMIKRLESASLSRPGAERAIRLLRLGRETHGWLEGNGYRIGQPVCLSGNAHTAPLTHEFSPVFE